MPKIWKSIVLAVAALVGSGATAQCITPEYVDSLRIELAEREMPEKITYTIRSGDTLGGIAARYKVKVSDLKRWSGLSGDFIREGRKLVIYKH